MPFLKVPLRSALFLWCDFCGRRPGADSSKLFLQRKTPGIRSLRSYYSNKRMIGAIPFGFLKKGNISPPGVSGVKSIAIHIQGLFVPDTRQKVFCPSFSDRCRKKFSPAREARRGEFSQMLKSKLSPRSQQQRRNRRFCRLHGLRSGVPSR